jgi:hypothetical protein
VQNRDTSGEASALVSWAVAVADSDAPVAVQMILPLHLVADLERVELDAVDAERVVLAALDFLESLPNDHEEGEAE